MCNKKYTKTYPCGIIKTLSLYIIASLFCMSVKAMFFGYQYSFRDIFFNLIKFSGAGYSWYIRMYIVLYIVIPFVNFIWNFRSDKKYHQCLTLGIIIITILPSILNITADVVPDHLGSLYPVTYYLIGAYIKKYDIKIKRLYNFIALILCVIGFGTVNYILNMGETFVDIRLVKWGSVENIIDGILVFAFFLHMPLENIHKWCEKAILKISELSLVIYLISECFDKCFYGILNSKVPIMQQRLEWYPVIVFAVFTCSMFFAQIIVWIYDYISDLAQSLLKRKIFRYK